MHTIHVHYIAKEQNKIKQAFKDNRNTNCTINLRTHMHKRQKLLYINA